MLFFLRVFKHTERSWQLVVEASGLVPSTAVDGLDHILSAVAGGFLGVPLNLSYLLLMALLVCLCRYGTLWQGVKAAGAGSYREAASAQQIISSRRPAALQGAHARQQSWRLGALAAAATG